MRRIALVTCTALMGIVGSYAYAAVSPEEADKLGKDLTAVGAEKAGNKDGTIPAWEGGDAPLAGWKIGEQRSDFSKFKDEKALFTIDASNVDKYADKLTDGEIYALKNVKGYQMDVYPAHRTCAIPPTLAERTKKNALEAKIDADGTSLAHAVTGGVPFPIPKTGVEVLTNHRLRPSGMGHRYELGGSVISPRPGSDEFVFYNWTLTTYHPIGNTDFATWEEAGKGVEFFQYYTYSAPPALSGQGLVNINYQNKDPESYYYFPGQRRVRRLPSYTFDTPLIGFENQYLVDEQFMLWSTLDRFDYKLIGKKEIYAQAHAFGPLDFKKPHEAVFGKTFVEPKARRYELQRVWVVEATLKSGFRHVAPHRFYYVNEDSWNIVELTDFDANGKVWKNVESFPIPVWELGGVCNFSSYTMWDLQAGRYTEDYFSAGQGQDMYWFPAGTKDRQDLKPDFFTPEMLRSISDR
jgi:hypothetical protein